MKAPRPNLLAWSPPDVAGDVVTLARPAAAIAGTTLVAIVVGDAAIDQAPAGWTLVDSVLAGGMRWTLYRRTLVVTDVATEWAWTFAAGATDPAGVLLVYDDVSPGTVIGAVAAAVSGAGNKHDAPSVAAASSTYEEICLWYSEDDLGFPIVPAGMVELVNIALPSGDEDFLVARMAPLDVVPTLPVRQAETGGVTTCSMLSVVIRDGLPITPAELADLVPGNIGLAPALPRPRPATGAYQLSGGVLVPQDGPDDWYVPETEEQFEALGFDATDMPDSLYLCQEAAGSVIDQFGADDLAALSSPLYQQAVPGWARFGVGFDPGSSDAFRRSSGQTPDPTTTSSLWLFYFYFPSDLTNNRFLVAAANGGSSVDSIRMGLIAGGGNRLRVQCDGVNADGTVAHPVGSHVYALQHNRAGTAVNGCTELDRAAPAYSAGIIDGDKGLRNAGGTGDGIARVVWGCKWDGAKAEITLATLKQRLERLGITIAWSP